VNPELSRRVARVLHLANPDIETRDRVIQAIRYARAFEELPDWLKKMILDVEKQHPPRRESAPEPPPSVGTRQLTESAVALQPSPAGKGRYRVLLIRAGWGSSGYYSEEVLRRDGPKAFPAGTHNYLNHPTPAEAAERPEGDVLSLASVTVTDPVWDPIERGLVAEVQIFPQWQGLLNPQFVREIGLSIRANGTVEYGEAEGQQGPIVTSIDEGISVDWVTRPGAGGKVLQLIESARQERAAKVSDRPWSDFSQADYTIEQWRRACLVGPDTQSDRKADYKLPVREPDGTLNRNGVYAAAARIGQVDAPAPVVKAAARKLISLYRNELGEEPPESLLRLAGEKPKQEAAPSSMGGRGSNEDDTTSPRQASVGEARLAEGRNIGAWLEAQLHRAASDLTDELYGGGNLTRDERLALSRALGDALEAFARRIGTDVPHLYERDLFDDPNRPARTRTKPARKKEEGPMPDRSTEDQALEEAARERARAQEAELRLARYAALEAARPIAAGVLAESGLPAPAQHRLLASITADSVPLTEAGTLDEDALRRRLEEAINQEASYLAQLAEASGAGQVRGLGESSRVGGSAPVPDAGITAALAEAYRNRGLSEDAARLAALGRP